jgi:hypothetical protein
MMRNYSTQVALDKNVRTISDINQHPHKRFFNWLTDRVYSINKMYGAVHCEAYQVFKFLKFLRIGISYAKEENSLQIFPNEDYSKAEEERIPLFSDKESSVKDISKYLSDHRPNEYYKIMEQNKYRGMVQQTLYNQPISYFMNANCKDPFSDALFRFPVKARNQCLMTNYMRKLIFREGNLICGICQKDRQDTVNYILNGCNRMCTDYISRHKLIFDRLSEAIKLNCNLASEVFENTQVKISPKEGKNNKPYHTLVRPDIWYWTNEYTKDLIPEQQRILHLVEVKSCWVPSMNQPLKKKLEYY